MKRAIERIKKIKMGNPLDTETMMGAQASQQQLDKIMSYMDVAKADGAELLIGGYQAKLEGELEGGYYIAPTVFKGTNDMRIFQEEIFGPFLSVTTFKDFDEAMAIANDSEFGLGAGVWSRNMDTAYRAVRGVQSGRVWTNTYHQYPAHAAFGGYKTSGIGRENHLMMRTTCPLMGETITIRSSCLSANKGVPTSSISPSLTNSFGFSQRKSSGFT